MLTVILDSCVLHGSRGRSIAFTQLLTLSYMGKLKLVIPEIVLKEIVRQNHEDAVAAIDSCRKALATLTTLGNQRRKFGAAIADLKREASNVLPPSQSDLECQFRDQFKMAKVEIERIPEVVTIESILVRDLAKKKPFNQKGQGFRDCLIWETIKGILKNVEEGDSCFFVTENSKDFCDNQGKLAPELLSEIEHEPARLLLLSSLKDVLEQPEISPLRNDLKIPEPEVSALLSSSGDQAEISEVLLTEIRLALSEFEDCEIDFSAYDQLSPLTRESLKLPSAYDSATIQAIDIREDTLQSQAYLTSDSEKILLTVGILVEVSIDGFAYKTDVPEDIYARDLYDFPEFEVIDPDWNDHMVYAETLALYRLTFAITLHSQVSEDNETEEDHDAQLQGLSGRRVAIDDLFVESVEWLPAQSEIE